MEEAPSSINLLRAEPAGPTPPMSARAVAVQAARGHMQFLAMMHVMLLHNEPLWGGVRGGIGECRPPCSMLVALVSDVIYPVAMPTFFALAVLNERRQATKQARLEEEKTEKEKEEKEAIQMKYQKAVTIGMSKIMKQHFLNIMLE